jgi:hypothetical protein
MLLAEFCRSVTTTGADGCRRPKGTAAMRIPLMILKRLHHEESAQALVEFAIIAIAATWIFLGTVDFGRFLYYDNGLRSAARVGAEVASQHCPFRDVTCTEGGSNTPVADKYVLWATSCEAAPNLTLLPQYTSCPPGSTPPCIGTCTNCTADICVTPDDATRVTHSSVNVSVGYSFKPINAMVNILFPEQSCYTGDNASTNHHTLCATSVGRVY